jgi:hypothetical protein
METIAQETDELPARGQMAAAHRAAGGTPR